MNINDEFRTESKFLKSTDLQGHVAKVKIAGVSHVQLGNNLKLVMAFVGKAKSMVLNVTNAKTIAEAFGPETDNWVGGEIEVFSMKVDYQGKMVDGLRIRVPPARRTAQPQNGNVNMAPNARDRAHDHELANWAKTQAQAPNPAAYDDGWRGEGEVTKPASTAPAPAAAGYEDLNDDVPF